MLHMSAPAKRIVEIEAINCRVRRWRGTPCNARLQRLPVEPCMKFSLTRLTFTVHRAAYAEGCDTRGSAPPCPLRVALTGRQDSRDAADRSVAPSVEALDAGLRHQDFSRCRQPATRLPGDYLDRTRTGRQTPAYDTPRYVITTGSGKSSFTHCFSRTSISGSTRNRSAGSHSISTTRHSSRITTRIANRSKTARRASSMTRHHYSSTWSSAGGRYPRSWREKQRTL